MCGIAKAIQQSIKLMMLCVIFYIAWHLKILLPSEWLDFYFSYIELVPHVFNSIKGIFLNYECMNFINILLLINMI